MRKYLTENDLISAEVQKVLSQDGGGMAMLHTRSLRYGKLSQGVLVKCSPSLIKPRKNHFHTFPFGVSIIIGNNGYIWIYPTSELDNMGSFDPSNEIVLEKSNITVEQMESLSRVRNCVIALSKYNMMIY